MLIKTQDGTYCNTRYIATLRVQDFYAGGIDRAVRGTELIASMVNGKDCVLGSYNERKEAEEALEKLLSDTLRTTQEMIYQMPK